MSETGTILIRADASVSMGTGHVMRCLALAQAWQDRGGRVVYAMAETAPGMVERLNGANIEVVKLSAAPGSECDAMETAAIARSQAFEWVVLDGYHFSVDYQRRLKEAGPQLLLLDDFGALGHYWADLILNQDPIADEQLYVNRETYSKVLLGTRYTFIRREFRNYIRPRRRATATARRLLITLGGSDPENVTETVIRSLNAVEVDELKATVLVGPSNPHKRQLEKAAADCNKHVQLLCNPPDIPAHMAACDMAITAGGSTVWELAYFRVPCVVLIAADNQMPSMRLLHDREACICLDARPDDGRPFASEALAPTITLLCNDASRRDSLGKTLGEMSDGNGAPRVCDALASNCFKEQPA
jgi:UDP-2,4-diacetamido-2,4,6-trideoxy-beta-L-altropyranose hydrolase